MLRIGRKLTRLELGGNLPPSEVIMSRLFESCAV